MESAESIAELYGEHTQLATSPAASSSRSCSRCLTPGEAVLFTCGWTDMGEKWGPLAQLTVTTRRIVDQRWAGPGASAPPRAIALRDVRAVAERQRGAAALFSTHALVVALADGTTLEWEHLTNHQIEPAVAAIEGALEDARLRSRRSVESKAAVSLDERRWADRPIGPTVNASPSASSPVAGGDHGGSVTIATPRRLQCHRARPGPSILRVPAAARPGGARLPADVGRLSCPFLHARVASRT